jgi:hypothetical protein
MTELLPPAGGRGHRAVAIVLEGLAGAGVPLPPVVFVDEGVERWWTHAVGVPVETRRRSVVAAASAPALWRAVELGLGGAVRLPVSTPALEEACRSVAAVGVVPPVASDGVVESLLAADERLWVAAFTPFGLWRRQWGTRGLHRRLGAIAERLGAPPVIIPGPALVVAGRAEVDLAAACRAVPGARLLDLSDRLGAGRPEPEELVAAVLAAGATLEPDPGPVHHPVMELPGGRQVGRWTASRSTVAIGPGWTAAPASEPADGRRWRLEGEGWEGPVIDLDGGVDLTADRREVLRLPGRIGAELRRGSPSALIVEQLARHGGRGGRPIWVPSVDPEGVRLLLGLPGPIWVDGPGVPASG